MPIFGIEAPKIVVNYGDVDHEFAADDTTDLITPASPADVRNLKKNDRVTLTSTGILPAPLQTSFEYWVRDVDTTNNTFKLATARNGAAIDVTDTGTGTHRYTAEREVELDRVEIVTDEPVINHILNESALSGSRSWVHRGRHWVYEVIVNIYKEALPRSLYEELFVYYQQDKDIVLYRHKDTQPMKDEAGSVASFKITRMKELYLGDITYKDRLLLRFESKSWVDTSETFLYQPEGNFGNWTARFGGLAPSANGTDTRGFAMYDLTDGSVATDANYETYDLSDVDLPVGVTKEISFIVARNASAVHAPGFSLSLPNASTDPEGELVVVVSPIDGELDIKDDNGWLIDSISERNGDEIFVRLFINYQPISGSNRTMAITSAYCSENPLDATNNGENRAGNTTMSAPAIQYG